MVEKKNYSKQINKICEIISNDIKKLSYVSLVKNFYKTFNTNISRIINSIKILLHPSSNKISSFESFNKF